MAAASNPKIVGLSCRPAKWEQLPGRIQPLMEPGKFPHFQIEAIYERIVNAK